MDTERIARVINSSFTAYKLGYELTYKTDLISKFLKCCIEADKRYNDELCKLTQKVMNDVDVSSDMQVKNILDALFDDGIINWGRIIMVFVFGAKLAVLSKDTAKLGSPELITRYIDEYVKSELLDWIKDSGGWVSNTFNYSTVIVVVILHDKAFTNV